MKSKKLLLILILLLTIYLPIFSVDAKTDKYKIVSGDIKTVGSEICFGNECFYVVSINEYTVSLFAKHNLYVGYSIDESYNYTELEPTYLQDPNAIGYKWENGEKYPFVGTVPFSNISNKFDGSVVEEYAYFYKQKLSELGVNVASVRLINLEELKNLGCDSTTYLCDKAPKWVYSSSYWVDVPNDVARYAWYVDNYSYFVYTNYYNDYLYGVRPVVEVPIGYFKEEIEGVSFVDEVSEGQVSEGVISKNDTGVDVIFNDLGQEAVYEAVLYNGTDNDLYINSLEVLELSEDFVDIELDEKSENIMVKANSSSKVMFRVKTLAQNGAGRNFSDDIVLNFKLSDEMTNPSTDSNLIEIIILIVILCGAGYYVKNCKNKKVSACVLIGIFSLTSIVYVNAKESLNIRFYGKIKYVSQNNIMPTGTVLDDHDADYTNSKEVWAYYDQIKNIKIFDLVNEPKKYYEKFDLSVDGVGSVLGYLVENSDEEVPYDLLIMAQGIIFANYDSSFLFSFPNVETIVGLGNIDYSNVYSALGMFYGDKKLTEFENDLLDLSNVYDASYLLYGCENLNYSESDFNLSESAKTDYIFINSLYESVKNGAVTDKNEDFKNEVVNSGKYYIDNTGNDEFPIYYYRGDIDNNNVEFAGKCWKIIRTTNTGGIKLIYSGDFRGGSIGCSSPSITDFDRVSYSSIKSRVSSSGYMNDGFVNTEQTFKVLESSLPMVFGNNVSYENGVYTLVDTYELKNTTDMIDKLEKYHYTCLNASNSCESVAYVYQISLTTMSYYLLDSGNDYDDLMYSIFGVNSANSNIKTEVDTWFSSVLSGYHHSLEDDIVLCNDRSYVSSGFNSINSRLDLHLESLSFYNRLKKGTYKLTCDNISDTFTTSSSNGNGKLNSPVGLITMDEATLIGYSLNKANDTFLYLFNNNYGSWTMSTDAYVLGGEKIISSSSNYKSHFIRPVISLKNDILYFSGNGSASRPYRLVAQKIYPE